MKRPSLWLTVLWFLFAACLGQAYVRGGERAKYYTMLDGESWTPTFHLPISGKLLQFLQ